MAGRRDLRGFTYLWLLFLLAAGSAGLAAIAQPIRLAVQRDREAELRFRGHEIARALSTYRDATPGADKQLPASLDDLLDDRRGARPRRHLRRVYADPFTGRPDWILETTDDGRIAAVHSRSDTPLLRDVDLPRASDDDAPRPASALVFRASDALVPEAAASAAAPASAASTSRLPPNDPDGDPPPLRSLFK